MKTINTIQEFNDQIINNRAIIFYFSHTQCNVCKVLLPKIEELIDNNFPEINLFYCNTEESKEIAAQNRIFTVPSMLIYFDQKQYFQFSRNISIQELSNTINRPYNMIFNQ